MRVLLSEAQDMATRPFAWGGLEIWVGEPFNDWVEISGSSPLAPNCVVWVALDSPVASLQSFAGSTAGGTHRSSPPEALSERSGG